MAPKLPAVTAVRRRAARLETVHHTDGDKLRQTVVDALHSLSPADHAFFMPIVDIDGSPHVPEVWGASDDMDRLSRAMSAVREDTADLPDVSTVFQPSQLQPIERRSFMEHARLKVSLDELQRSTYFQRVYVPARVRGQLRLLVTHGRSLLGLVGFLRDQDLPGFDSGWRRRLAPLVEPVKAALTAADRFMNRGLPGPGDLVMRPDGEVEFASKNGRAWLRQKGFRRALKREVLRFDSGEEAEQTVGVRGAEARLVRLDAAGGVRYLANLVPASPRRIPPAADLTPRQLEVADYALVGATVEEIGDTLGISPNTVKDHLKKIYGALGVANRLELREAMSDEEPT